MEGAGDSQFTMWSILKGSGIHSEPSLPLSAVCRGTVGTAFTQQHLSSCKKPGGLTATLSQSSGALGADGC